MEELPKVMLVAIGTLTIGVCAGRMVDPSSPVAVKLRRLCSTRLAVSLLAFAVFAFVTEDVLERESDDLVLILDHGLRPVAQATAERPWVRAAAATLSWLTGEGLAFALLAAGLVLYARRRQKEAAVVVVGTLSAWGASGFLKLLLAIPRPRPEIWQYAFPSGHVFVTLVALGLMAWVAGRRGSSSRQTWLMACAVGVAALTGLARLVLDMHWLSDVIGGLAVGTVWLNATIVLAERSLALESAPPARVRRSPVASRRPPLP